MEIPPEYITDSRLIRELYRLMYHAHIVLYRHNVSYYASGGTLIGALRHGGIIPFDNDLDIEVSYKDAPTITSREFRADLKRRGYKIKFHHESNAKYDWIKISGKRISGTRLVPELDVFFTETVDIDGEYYTRLRGLAGGVFYKNIYKASDVYPLKRAQFGDMWIPVPRGAKKALSHQYGRDWNRKAYITQCPNSHIPLDTAIPIKSRRFYPATPFYRVRSQPDTSRSHPLLSGLYLHSLA
jgi:phosphorylcholine metabolism protein LicD